MIPPPKPPAAPHPAILVVEDEPTIADTITYALRTESFEPVWVTTAGAARETLRGRVFALVILDIGLPDGNGFDLCREIRAHENLPVIFLTARSDEIDRVVGLEIGADDYIVKPFSPRELTARVRAVLRRTGAMGSGFAFCSPPTSGRTEAPDGAAGSRRPSLTPFSVDEARCEVRYHGEALPLTRREYRLLLALLAHPGRVFTREQLLVHAWDEPEASLDRTVDAHIKTLRAKLRAVRPEVDPIRTHRGFGYSIDVPRPARTP